MRGQKNLRSMKKEGQLDKKNQDKNWYIMLKNGQIIHFL